MRAWIVSDIHTSIMDRLWGSALVVPDADICICAGDVTDTVGSSIKYLKRHIEPRMPVILTLGNHDCFDSTIEAALERARHQIQGTRISLLENQALCMGNCRFVGATLWTDFAVSVGGDEYIPPEERRAKAMRLLPSLMPDYRHILSDDRPPIGNGFVTPREILERHIESRRYIDQALGTPFDGRTIVVSHHLPLVESFDPLFHGSTTNAAFGSDLSDLILRRRPSIWIHGHVHRGRDYRYGETRILCNPRGFDGGRERNGFRPDLVIEI